MPPITAVAYIAVLLAAVTQCAAKCSYTAKVGMAIDSKFSVRLANVSSLQNCLLFLEQHADSFAAVAFNEVTLDCCTVPATDDYKLIESAGWSTYYIESRRSSSVAFTSSGKFTVPAGVTTLKVLAVGGGAGGSRSNGGGGGSGYVAFAVLNVTQGQQYDVIVGSGGPSDRIGGNTTFGNNLVVANGGYVKDNGDGGAGGSGGGANTEIGFTASGGSAGSDGENNNHLTGSGKGQGSSFTSNFNQFRLSTLSAGSGAAGVAVTSSFYPGGGGGGGVLINGAGINSSMSECYMNGVWYGPRPASGYGAGGSGGCFVNGTVYKGGSGASGLVYIEYQE